MWTYDAYLHVSATVYVKSWANYYDDSLLLLLLHSGFEGRLLKMILLEMFVLFQKIEKVSFR